MKRIPLICRVCLIVYCVTLSAVAGNNIALFGSVVNVAENDVLNVRQAPSFRAKKIASLPPDAYVGVDICKIVDRSRWCKVHHIAQHDYEGYGWDAPDGWVNAKYLSFHNRGYVLVDGKANCDYVVGCKEGVCERVVDYETNKKYEIISIRTEKIVRSRLRGESHFGAMSENGDGYCTNGRMIEDFLAKQNKQKPDSQGR